MALPAGPAPTTRTSTPALVTRASGGAIEGDAAEENPIAGELGKLSEKLTDTMASKADHDVAVVDRKLQSRTVTKVIPSSTEKVLTV